MDMRKSGIESDVLMKKKEHNVSFLVSEEKCNGCSACELVCKQTFGRERVKLTYNKDSYLVREVCEAACTDCGKCAKVCSVNNPPGRLQVDDSFAVYPESMEQARDSASGGFAWKLGKEALKEGYQVIGAVWDFDGEKITVKDTIAENEEELKRQRKSKYVQADVREAFDAVRKLEKVMVFGTPCQIAGLRNLYGEREGLVLVDMDCMGPAGQKLLDKYTAYLNSKNSSGIKEIFMRDKKKDWMNYGIRVVFQDGTVYFQDKYKDPFCQLFNFAHSIHDACDGCIYANHSAADIRMGDAWDYLGDMPKRVWKYGASLVSIQNAKGKEWLEKLSGEMVIKKVSRKIPEIVKHPADERVLASIRDDSQTIEDAVRLYQDKPVLWKIKNMAERVLSRNLVIYYWSKKIARKLK